MRPRKASAAAIATDSTDGAPAATRRSARISTQVKDDTPGQAGGGTSSRTRATTTKNNAKKRSAATEAGEDDGANAESHKKAKSTAAESEEEKPQPLAPIDIGDVLPALTLKNENDEDVQIADLAAESGVVMFLVPKADTPGCTNQACGFRDVYEEFTSAGYDVYCLSADTPAAQSKWQTKKELPYHLLSDRHRVLIGALGAGEGGKTKRSHFIFEKGGKLVEKAIPVKPNDSSKLALEFAKSTAN